MSEPITIVLPLPSREPWTKAEDQILRDAYPNCPLESIAVQLGRTLNAVRGRRLRLGIPIRIEPWSEQEKELLRSWYQSRKGRPIELHMLAAQLGKHKTNVSRKARELGLSDKCRTTVEKINGRYLCRVPKYATDAERNAALSASRKKWILENGHPRGALGMKHSEQTKKVLSEKSRAGQARLSSREKKQRTDKMIATRLDRYGTCGHSFGGSSNPFSRCKGGRRPDLENMYFRSKWEANYARYLKWLKEHGKIRQWEYEKKTFRFPGIKRGAITYTPDFRVVENDGTERYHEVKGWMTKQSKTRLKRMAKYFPSVEIVLIAERQYRDIAKFAAGFVPGWE